MNVNDLTVDEAVVRLRRLLTPAETVILLEAMRLLHGKANADDCLLPPAMRRRIDLALIRLEMNGLMSAQLADDVRRKLGLLVLLH